MKRIICLLSLFSTMQMLGQAQVPDSVLKSKLADARRNLMGVGIYVNHLKAFELYSECASLGSLKAMNILGLMCLKGQGTTANRQTGISWLTTAGNGGYLEAWYNLGLLYKNDPGVGRDYGVAYQYFKTGADLGDDQCIYSVAYMHYKGLGCEQSYQRAATLFQQGSKLGRPNSMYFYGLCLRNGYGVEKNLDSAIYWLTKAANKGYKMAIMELATPNGENNNHNQSLASQSKNVFSDRENLNKYRKLENTISINDLSGKFEGQLIKYDWSGQHVISSSALSLNLSYTDNKIIGTWVQSDSITVPIEVILTPSSLIFVDTKYSRTDYYSPKKPIQYKFESASLQWVRKGETMYLEGNVQMFSTQRNEPEKPLFISLSRRIESRGISKTGNILLTKKDGNPLQIQNDLSVYPNPFTNNIIVDFQLKEKGNVQTQILTIDGKLVYSSPVENLEAGYFQLPIDSRNIKAGSYVLKLMFGTESKSIKIVKQ